jgi:hypothetical protein
MDLLEFEINTIQCIWCDQIQLNLQFGFLTPFINIPYKYRRQPGDTLIHAAFEILLQSLASREICAIYSPCPLQIKLKQSSSDLVGKEILQPHSAHITTLQLSQYS